MDQMACVACLGVDEPHDVDGVSRLHRDHPYFIPTTRANRVDLTDRADANTNNDRLLGSRGCFSSTTQIYEGTNQIQRVVISKRLLG